MNEYRVTARNTAAASANRIHSDEVARQYGFRGGLVPGVDVFAYLSHPPARRWGPSWLAEGAMSAQFRRPVYDGDRIAVTGEDAADGKLQLALLDSAGETCAGATAWRRRPPGPGPDPAAYPSADVPAEPPPPSAASLAAGRVLGSVSERYVAGQAGTYLAEIGEDLPYYSDEGLAHPGWLLRFANRLLMANIDLGPWIHVASECRFFAAVRDGDLVGARGKVAEEYERRGHRFAVLDVLILADERPAWQVLHTAIHTLRPPGG